MILNVGCGDNTIGDVRIDIREYKKGLNLIADAHNLPLRDKIVDGALCDSVLEHLENPYKGLLEMTRVSKSKLRIKIPNVYYFKRILRAILNPYYKVKPGVLHLQAWDLLAMKRLVKQIEGLEIIKLGWVDFVFKFFGIKILWPSLFFGWNMLVFMEVKK